mmetsp:Transcript_82394/g.229541  ORF Transcript_82394/g.229541 Transcript_82394/m.229541 type:complete len:87 (+) Transcript_82394:317-577(+)
MLHVGAIDTNVQGHADQSRCYDERHIGFKDMPTDTIQEGWRQRQRAPRQQWALARKSQQADGSSSTMASCAETLSPDESTAKGCVS